MKYLKCNVCGHLNKLETEYQTFCSNCMKKILLGIFVIGICFIGSVLIPALLVSEDKTIEAKGVVYKVYEAGDKDIVFKLENNDTSFYINRGIELGLKINDLEQELMGKEIVIKYQNYRTILNWYSKSKHISKVEFKDKIIFNEFKNIIN